MRCIILSALSALILLGCGSTPYEDDNTLHIDLMANKHITEQKFTFSFADSNFIDLRGIYKSDNTIGQSPILYQGGAGIVGLLVQLGAHAAIINSKSNGKVSKFQQEANIKVQSLIDATKGLLLANLITKEQTQNLLDTESANIGTLMVQPIFFSDIDMTNLMLKLIVWLPRHVTKTTRKSKIKYQNMIEVYLPAFNESEIQQIQSNNNDALIAKLSQLLQTSLYVAKNQISGKYTTELKKPKTFIVKQNGKNKVIRGSLVESVCGFQVIKNLNSWLIAIPSANSQVAHTVKQC